MYYLPVANLSLPLFSTFLIFRTYAVGLTALTHLDLFGAHITDVGMSYLKSTHASSYHSVFFLPYPLIAMFWKFQLPSMEHSAFMVISFVSVGICSFGHSEDQWPLIFYFIIHCITNICLNCCFEIYDIYVINGR